MRSFKGVILDFGQNRPVLENLQILNRGSKIDSDFLIEHLTHQKGPEQLSADHSTLIDFYQLISNEDFRILEYIVQELHLTDFDESTIILTARG